MVAEYTKSALIYSIIGYFTPTFLAVMVSSVSLVIGLMSYFDIKKVDAQSQDLYLLVGGAFFVLSIITTTYKSMNNKEVSTGSKEWYPVIALMAYLTIIGATIAFNYYSVTTIAKNIDISNNVEKAGNVDLKGFMSDVGSSRSQIDTINAEIARLMKAKADEAVRHAKELKRTSKSRNARRLEVRRHNQAISDMSTELRTERKNLKIAIQERKESQKTKENIEQKIDEKNEKSKMQQIAISEDIAIYGELICSLLVFIAGFLHKTNPSFNDDGNIQVDLIDKVDSAEVKKAFKYNSKNAVDIGVRQTLKEKKSGFRLMSERAKEVKKDEVKKEVKSEVKKNSLYKPSLEEYFNIVAGIDRVNYPTSKAIRDKLRGLSYRSDSKFVTEKNKQLITKGLIKKVGRKIHYIRKETA